MSKTMILKVRIRVSNEGGWHVDCLNLANNELVDYLWTAGNKFDAMHEATQMSVKWNMMGHRCQVSAK